MDRHNPVGDTAALAPPATTTATTITVLAIVVLTGVFHCSTMRAGHDWGDDFSMYVQHAKNLAEGRPYAETRYIYNPFRPMYAPRAYPPAFPLLLAPVYRVYGLDFEAMKLVGVGFFLLLLVVVARLFATDLSPRYLLLCLGSLALSPYLWVFKNKVLSDLPFTCFVYLSILSMRPNREESDGGRARGVVIGCAAYLAYATRVAGIVLVPALLVQDLVRFRRVTRRSLTAVAVFAALALAQALVLPGDATYLRLFSIDPSAMAQMGGAYADALKALWDNRHSTGLARAMWLVTGPLAIGGLAVRVATALGVAEIFVVLYAAVLVSFSGYQSRYLIPLLPFYFFYAVLALQWLGRRAGRRGEGVMIAACIAAVALSYGLRYSSANYGPLKRGIAKRTSVEFFGYVRQATSTEDVFVLAKPRLLALLTDRRGSVYEERATDGRLWEYVDGIGGSYIVVGPTDRAYWRDFVSRSANRLELRYSNADFAVYRVKPRAAAAAELRAGHDRSR